MLQNKNEKRIYQNLSHAAEAVQFKYLQCGILIRYLKKHWHWHKVMQIWTKSVVANNVSHINFLLLYNVVPLYILKVGLDFSSLIQIFFWITKVTSRLPRWLVVTNSLGSVGDLRDAGSISVPRSSPGGGHGSPHQYYWLENSMNWGAWQSKGCKKLDTTEAT